MQLIEKIFTFLRMAVSLIALVFVAWLIKTGEVNTILLNLWLGT